MFQLSFTLIKQNKKPHKFRCAEHWINSSYFCFNAEWKMFENEFSCFLVFLPIFLQFIFISLNKTLMKNGKYVLMNLHIKYTKRKTTITFYMLPTYTNVAWHKSCWFFMLTGNFIQILSYVFQFVLFYSEFYLFINVIEFII